MAFLEKLGEAFTVNTTTTDHQGEANITALPDGSFIVIWSDQSSGNDSNICAQRFDAQGQPLGGEFTVNTDLTGWQNGPSITPLANGGFVITWDDWHYQYAGAYDNSWTGVRGQMFDENGQKVGGEFQANTHTFDNQIYSQVTALQNGGFVVTWTSSWQGDDSAFGIRAQVYDASGETVGTEIHVNTTIEGSQELQVAAAIEGGFVVAWTSYPSSIMMQRFDENGVRIDGETTIDVAVNGISSDSLEAVTLTDGRTLLTWSANEDDGSGYGSWAQFVDTNGDVIGAPVKISDTGLLQIAALPGGGFCAAWVEYTYGSGTYVKIQVFDDAGLPVGSEFWVNADSYQDSNYPDIAALPDGTILVTWESLNTKDGAYETNVEAQILTPSITDSDGGAPTLLTPPEFTNPSFEVSLAEGAVGVLDVDATDPNGLSVTYSLVEDGPGADHAQFIIDPVTGDLQFWGAPDFENPQDSDGDNIYTVTVRATNENGVSTDQTVSVTVQDVVESTVVEARVIEGATSVLTFGSAGGRTFAIYEGGLGVDHALFNINATTGALTFKAKPDFENPKDFDRDNVYTVTVRIYEANGVDYIDETVSVTVEDKYLFTGTSNSEKLVGDNGDDLMRGLSGNDTLYGGAGSDFLDGGSGNDVLYADSGLYSHLVGGSGNDTLNGGTGADYLVGGTGADRLVGGAAGTIDPWDVVGYESSTAGVIVDLNRTTAQVSAGDANGDVLVNIEGVLGSAYADKLTGNGHSNELIGGGGHDTLTGGAGNDYLIGDSDLILLDTIGVIGGNDLLIGGTGADYLNGGAGIDTASYATSTKGVTVDLSLDTHQVSAGDAAGDALFNIERLAGSAYGDKLTGDGNSNTLSGAAGNDTLAGGGGNDSLDGGDGNDTLSGGLDFDTLNGGAGTDTADYTFYGLDVLVDLAVGRADFPGQNPDGLLEKLISIENVRTGIGHDTLIGSTGNNVLEGGAGADSLDGGAGIDTASYASSEEAVSVSLLTGDGYGGDAEGDVLKAIENLTGSAFDDLFEGNAAANRLVGGTGIDTVNYEGADKAVTVNLALTTAQVSTGYASGDILLGIENLWGSTLADKLTGSALANELDGRAGNDTLDGGAGADTLSGGIGNDVFIVDNAGDDVREAVGEGTDRVQSSVSYTLGANVDNLTLTGTAAINGKGNDLANVITGNAGANVIEGGAGADTLNGGTGVDTLSYQSSLEAVTVTLRGTTAATVSGGDAEGDVATGFENLMGSAFGDTLTGDAGANVLEGGAGADTLNGGGGIDTVSYASSADGVIVSLDAGLALNGDAEGDVLIGIENLTGSAFNDVLEGSGLANRINGGGGFDIVNYEAYEAAVTVNLSLTSAQVSTGHASSDVLVSIEGVWGSTRGDKLTGSSGHNELDGRGGNDLLDGAAGADTLYGSEGTDTATYATSTKGVTVNLDLDGPQVSAGDAGGDVLIGIENLIGSAYSDALTGDSGNNALSGGSGNDVLKGGLGADILTGGTGADSFVFTDLGSVDTITDFVTYSTATAPVKDLPYDKIKLSGEVFTGLTVGKLAASTFVKGTAALGAEDRIIYDAKTGALYYDADGSGTGSAAQQLAKLKAGLTLSAADFLII